MFQISIYLSLIFLLIQILGTNGEESACCLNPKIPSTYTGVPGKYEGLYCRDEFKDCAKDIEADKILCGHDEEGKWRPSPMGFCQGNDICKRDPTDEDNVICEHADGPVHSFVKCQCPLEHPHLNGQPVPGQDESHPDVLIPDSIEVQYCGSELNKLMNYTDYPFCPDHSIISCFKDSREEIKCPKGCGPNSDDKLKRACL